MNHHYLHQILRHAIDASQYHDEDQVYNSKTNQKIYDEFLQLVEKFVEKHRDVVETKQT